ncbi:MAG: Fe-S cluster assembly protein SufD, partial [Muribaculaceae bacterium]|nr:Fe-S cluster assembly protein SufD [Muribaculaceae bacterium]
MIEESLRQYIELYDTNREEIDAQSAPVLNRHREGALACLKHLVLPRKGDDNYENTDLRAILGADYGVNVRRVQLPVNPADGFHCGIPRVATSLFFIINDRLVCGADCREKLPEGIEVKSLREKALKAPEEVE